MDLFVIRHAIATPRSPEREDATRALTPEGRERFAAEVRGLAAIGVRFDALYHSPLVRAVETSALLAPVCGAAGVATDGLARMPRRRLLALLNGDPRALRVAVVGHEPWLSELVAWLATGDVDLADGFQLKKGAVVRLRGVLAPGGMTLTASLPPRFLRALGGYVEADGAAPTA